MSAQPPIDDQRAARIAHEVEKLRENNYACQWDTDRYRELDYLTIERQRDTQTEPQMYRIYLTLDRRFPNSPPNLTATVIIGFSANGDIREVEVEADSKWRVVWEPEDSLVTIVQDIDEHLQHDTPRVKPNARDRLFQSTQPDNTESDSFVKGQLPGRVSSDAHGQHHQERITAPLDSQAEKERTTQRLEELEEEKRVTMAKEPSPSHESSESASANQRTPGNLILVFGSIIAFTVVAILVYVLVRQPTPSNDNSTAQQISQLWTNVKSRANASSVEAIQQNVTDLANILNLNSNAVSPDDGVPAQQKLFEQRMVLGDKLYSSDLDAAAEQYAAAQKLMSDRSEPTDRLAWVARDKALRNGNVDRLQVLEKDLQDIASINATLTNPAGRTITQILYDVRISQATKILEQGNSVSEPQARLKAIEQARTQAELAAQVAEQVEDKGAAAEKLKQQIEQLREAVSTYRIVVSSVDQIYWQRLLDTRKPPLAGNHAADSQPNVIVLTPSAAMSLTLTDAQNQSQQVASGSTGSVALSLEPGSYRLRITDDGTTRETVLEFGEQPQSYLVKIIPRLAQ